MAMRMMMGGGGGVMGWLFGCARTSQKAVSSIGEVPQERDGTIKGEETDQVIHRVHPSILGIIGAVGVASATVTFFWISGILTDIASAITVPLSALAVYQKRKLQRLGGMRAQQNILRGHVNDLSQENKKLTGSIDTLQTNVDRVDTVEKELSVMAGTAKTNVDRLQYVVQENKRIMSEIKRRLAANIMQDVVRIVLMSDSNKDYTIGPQEIDLLVMRMNNMPGFDFDEGNFRKYYTNDGKSLHLTEMMAVFRNLLDDDVPEEENVFHLKPKQILKQ